MTGLAVIGAWLTMSINRFPKDWLTNPNIAVVMFVVLLTYIISSLVSTAICNSVASTRQ